MTHHYLKASVATCHWGFFDHAEAEAHHKKRRRLRVTQTVNGSKGVHCMLSKSRLMKKAA
jgi:hypothetical protein